MRIAMSRVACSPVPFTDRRTLVCEWRFPGQGQNEQNGGKTKENEAEHLVNLIYSLADQPVK